MCVSTLWVHITWDRMGWGGDKLLHIERKITSLVHSHPPSHYIRTHVFLPTTWTPMMFVHYPPFPHIFSWKLFFFRHWLVNLRRIVPEKTQWKWIWGMRQDSCDARFRWKKIRNPRAVARVSYEFTVTRNARRILPEKTQGIRGGWCSAHFSLKNTTISPGWAGVTCKFTVEMKARRILHEKTQRFLRGRREWHVNLQSKWKPGAFYTRKHNDFSAVGGGPRRGCILIRNRDWWRSLALAHMWDSTLWAHITWDRVGWAGDDDVLWHLHTCVILHFG